MSDLVGPLLTYLSPIAVDGPLGFLRLYWYFFVFEFPRYVATDLMVLLLRLVRRPGRRARSTIGYTVVVPVLNEGDTIAKTVRSLDEQSHPPRKIIIVNDGSTDATPRVCRALAARSERIRYLEQGERGGKSAALNRALQYVTTEVVVFIDSDSTFDRDAMENLVRRFRRSDVVAVGGSLRVRNRHESLLTAFQAIEYGLTIFLNRQAKSFLGILPIVSGAFGAFRTRAVRAIGGHDPGPGNDSDLTIDLRQRGGRIEFAHDAVCHTNAPTRLSALTKQRRRWNRNVVKNRLRKHRNVFSPFSPRFSLSNVISTLDPILYQVVFSWIWMIYIVQISLTYPQLLPAILISGWGLYTLSAGLQQLIVCALSERPLEDLGGLRFIPIFHFYRVYLRLVMMFAQFEEVFLRASLRDPFAPPKVQRVMPDW